MQELTAKYQALNSHNLSSNFSAGSSGSSSASTASIDTVPDVKGDKKATYKTGLLCQGSNGETSSTLSRSQRGF